MTIVDFVPELKVIVAGLATGLKSVGYQLEEAARYFSTTGEVPLMPRKVHEAMQAEWAGKGGLLRLRWPRPSAPALGGSGPLASPSGEGL